MSNTVRRLVGHVAVDAGLLYLGDPCYVIDKPLGKMAWGDFLRMYLSREGPHTWQIGNATAVVCHTGYGDGLYPVYAVFNKDDGRVMSITVNFNPK